MIRLPPLEKKGYIYPDWCMSLGWVLTFSSLVCIPVYAIYHVYHNPGETFADKFLGSFKPTITSTKIRRENSASQEETRRLNENNSCYAQRISLTDVDGGHVDTKQLDSANNSIGELV